MRDGPRAEDQLPPDPDPFRRLPTGALDGAAQRDRGRDRAQRRRCAAQQRRRPGRGDRRSRRGLQRWLRSLPAARPAHAGGDRVRSSGGICGALVRGQPRPRGDAGSSLRVRGRDGRGYRRDRGQHRKHHAGDPDHLLGAAGAGRQGVHFRTAHPGGWRVADAALRGAVAGKTLLSRGPGPGHAVRRTGAHRGDRSARPGSSAGHGAHPGGAKGDGRAGSDAQRGE